MFIFVNYSRLWSYQVSINNKIRHDKQALLLDKYSFILQLRMECCTIFPGNSCTFFSCVENKTILWTYITNPISAIGWCYWGRKLQELGSFHFCSVLPKDKTEKIVNFPSKFCSNYWGCNVAGFVSGDPLYRLLQV